MKGEVVVKTNFSKLIRLTNNLNIVFLKCLFNEFVLRLIRKFTVVVQLPKRPGYPHAAAFDPGGLGGMEQSIER